jgi:hypothetical protein
MNCSLAIVVVQPHLKHVGQISPNTKFLRGAFRFRTVRNTNLLKRSSPLLESWRSATVVLRQQSLASQASVRTDTIMNQERRMPISADNDKQTRIALKEKRLWDMKKAMQDHETEQAAVRSKTARLRALRLAEEAKAPPSEKPKRRTKKAVAG